MGLLDKTEQLHTHKTRSSLLDRAEGINLQPHLSPASKDDETKKKTILCFKDLLDASSGYIKDLPFEKAGLLYATGKQFLPFIMKGFDKTTLHKFRIPSERLSEGISIIPKGELKDWISLREYLDDAADKYHFFTPPGSRVSVMTDREYLENQVKLNSAQLYAVTDFFRNISLQRNHSTMFNSYEEMKPHLLTAELENLYINTFVFQLKTLTSELSISSEAVDELFLLNIINNVLYDIFQRSAFSLKEDNLLHLYLLSMSRQNQKLLEHQINRVLTEFFFGNDRSILHLVKIEPTE